MSRAARLTVARAVAQYSALLLSFHPRCRSLERTRRVPDRLRWIRSRPETRRCDQMKSSSSPVVLNSRDCGITHTLDKNAHAQYTYSNQYIIDFPSPVTQLSHIESDSSNAFKALTSLDPFKALGCDDISARLLKFCCDHFG